VHAGELLSVAAFEHLNAIRDRAHPVVETDLALPAPFLEQRTEVSALRTRFGTTAFLRLKDRPVEAFLERLRARYGTSAVPGRFFEMPGHLRIGMRVNTAMFSEGLRRTGRALNEARLAGHAVPGRQGRRHAKIPSLNQAALDFSSSRMMRRRVSSNLGAFPSRYSRRAALMRV